LGLPFDDSFLGRLRNRLTCMLVDHIIFRPVNRSFKVISAGTTEDKMEVGNPVTHSGVGINLKTNRPIPLQVRDAERALMTQQPSYKARARAIQAELGTHDAPIEGAALLEELARTRQRLLRAVN
jgi:hypothetical protein